MSNEVEFGYDDILTEEAARQGSRAASELKLPTETRGVSGDRQGTQTVHLYDSFAGEMDKKRAQESVRSFDEG